MQSNSRIRLKHILSYLFHILQDRFEIMTDPLSFLTSSKACTINCDYPPKTDTISSVGRFKFLFSENMMWRPTRVQISIMRRVTELMENETSFATDTLIPLITQELGVSLRALDWFVTNFSKKTSLVLHGVNIHQAYKDTLSQYRRRNFDPFRRCLDANNAGRITFDEHGITYETTVGQINFLSWAYKTHILRYIIGNINEIESDMNMVNRSRKRGTGKRKELSRAPTFKCTVQANVATIKF